MASGFLINWEKAPRFGILIISHSQAFFATSNVAVKILEEKQYIKAFLPAKSVLSILLSTYEPQHRHTHHVMLQRRLSISKSDKQLI